MQKSDIVRIRHMLEAAKEVQSFVAGKTRSDLELNRVFVLACTRLFEIIGEAAAQVSPEFRTGHPEIPWAKIIGMRNRLIHAYFDVNLDVLWETIVFDIPPLIPILDDILQSQEG